MVALLPKLEADQREFGRFDVERCCFEDPATLDRLVYADHANGFVLAVFDWGRWLESNPSMLAINSIEAAGLWKLCFLFTAHARQDHFVGGHLAAMCREGVIQAMLRRLAALRDDPAIRQPRTP